MEPDQQHSAQQALVDVRPQALIRAVAQMAESLHPATLLPAAAGVVLTGLIVVLSGGASLSYPAALAGATTSGFCVFVAVGRRSRQRTAWVLTASGAGLWCIGQGNRPMWMDTAGAAGDAGDPEGSGRSCWRSGSSCWPQAWSYRWCPRFGGWPGGGRRPRG